MDFKGKKEAAPFLPLKKSIRHFLDIIVPTTEACPEEFQRDEQLGVQWARDLIGNVFLKYAVEPLTFSFQAKKFKTDKSWSKKTINADHKTINGLQRGTGLWWFDNDMIRTPKNLKVTWNNKRIPIGGQLCSVIRKKHPGLVEERFDNCILHIWIYGDDTEVCTASEETYLFQIINNNINLNAHMLRQASTYKIAMDIRKYSRFKTNPKTCVKLFKDWGKNKLFSKPADNKKMQFEELFTIICQLSLTGFSKNLTKTTLDELYANEKYKYGVTGSSTEFKKKINFIRIARFYTYFMYQILKDRRAWAQVDKGTFYSLMYYTHIHMKSGLQNKFDYKKLTDQFWNLHNELIAEPTDKDGNKLGGQSAYRAALISNSVKNLLVAENEWNRVLNTDGKLKYVIYRDPKRKYTTAEIAAALHEQGGVCAVDGLPSRLDEVVGGHDIAWSKGGLTILGNCIAIRKEYNDDMGTKSLEEYLEYLENES